MERLILEYQSGDGYTFSCTNTLPIVYANKQSAIDDLTTLLIQHSENEEQYQKGYEPLEKAVHDLVNKLKHLQKNGGREKEIQKASDNLTEAMQASRNYNEQKFPKNSFVFGGTQLLFSTFFYQNENGNKEIDMPQIFTLDEFFKHVEGKA